MKPLSGHEIRRRWVKFFEGKGHLFVPGVPLVPKGDKSLLFVNAGVTGLKKYFDGTEVPPCRRLVNVQKSIRTNDIENVGHTARHHTFFEMLGNFSIGDYFRKEVIAWASEILTDGDKGFGLPIERLYVTYNPSDTESFELWQRHGIAKDHLIPLQSNYWEIGSGPCGPNTEVFFDRGPEYDPEGLGVKLLRDDIENDRYIELWGIVFSQFNAVPGVPRSQYKELPSKNIDTGAGLERIACILQNTPTNFETDLFTPIIEESERVSGIPYKGHELSFRVIADHARCLTFALNDGARFSNEGRGYVLRRIIRRAMRYARQIGIDKPFIHTLVDIVSKSYSDFYPELLQSAKQDAELIMAEEEKFLHTLSSGEEMLSKLLEASDRLDGETIFKLYDTYGFPSDLTVEIAREKGATCDLDGFSALLEEAREKSRGARVSTSGFSSQSADLLAYKGESEFLYDSDACVSEVAALFKDGHAVEQIEDEGEVAFLSTPFYAEMGGQIGDTGHIEGEDFAADVIDTVAAPHGQHLHRVKVTRGVIKAGNKAELKIDAFRRRLIERNHSVTHLLHAALSRRLGHVSQEGSYVGPDYLRFDYAAPRKPTAEDIAEVEREVNSVIENGLREETRIMDLGSALKCGAEAEFSEKYANSVRVVFFGDYSKELCGGTHVKDASEIGLFVITGDEAVSSGVRRVTARTSKGAYAYLKEKAAYLEKADRRLDSTDENLEGKIEGLLEKNRELEKRISSYRESKSANLAKELSGKAETVGGVSFLYARLEGRDMKGLDEVGDALKALLPDSLILLSGGESGKFPIVLSSNGLALTKCKAGDGLREIMPLLSGRGGGRPNHAGGVAGDISGIEKAISLLKGKL